MKKMLSFLLIIAISFNFAVSASVDTLEAGALVENKTVKTDETMPEAIREYLYDNAGITQAERNILGEVNAQRTAEKFSMDLQTENTFDANSIEDLNEAPSIDLNLQEISIDSELQEAFSDDSQIKSYSWKDDGIILEQTITSENTFISYLYLNNGYLVKNVSYTDSDGNHYYVLNRNNETLEESNLNEYTEIKSLTEQEYNVFIEDVNNGLVEDKETYSYEYVRAYLNSKNGLSEDETKADQASLHQTALIADLGATYAQSSCNTGINRIAYKTKISMYESKVRPVTANASNPIVTKYSYINGLSKYYGSDTACIKIFDTRKHYVEYEKEFNIWKFGANVLTIYSIIKDTVNIKKDPASAILTYAGVIFDTLGNLTDNELKFMVRFDYKASFYREAQIFDRTKENDWVELPQLYQANVPIGMINLGADSTGSYLYAWGFTPDPSFYPVGFGYQAYADYVADIYYRNCVINGKWVQGKNAYGGLGGP